MKKRPTRDDVARLAEVSGATVSYVLNGRKDESIPQNTRNRVMRAAEALGYVPNLAARALVTGYSNLIALWVPSIYEPYFTRMIENVHRVLTESSYQVIVLYTSKCEDSIENLIQWPIDGVIAYDSQFAVSQMQAMNLGRRIPVVCTGLSIPDGVDSVTMDFRAGANKAMDHLIGLGRSRIAYLAPKCDYSQEDFRYEAYMANITAAGLEPEIIVIPEHRRECAYNTMIEYLDNHKAPGALFCYNDDLAVGVHRALRERGLRMPDDIALVGHDGIIDTEYVDPEITTISYPLGEVCKIAWEFLQFRMANPGAPLQQRQLEPEIIVRGSSVG